MVLSPLNLHYFTFDHSILLPSFMFKKDNNAEEEVSLGMIHGHSPAASSSCSITCCFPPVSRVCLWLAVRRGSHPRHSVSAVPSLLHRAAVSGVLVALPPWRPVTPQGSLSPPAPQQRLWTCPRAVSQDYAVCSLN